jgi:hypothetical protein
MPAMLTARLLEQPENRAEILNSNQILRGYAGFRP